MWIFCLTMNEENSTARKSQSWERRTVIEFCHFNLPINSLFLFLIWQRPFRDHLTFHELFKFSYVNLVPSFLMMTEEQNVIGLDINRCYLAGKWIFLCLLMRTQHTFDLPKAITDNWISSLEIQLTSISVLHFRASFDCGGGQFEFPPMCTFTVCFWTVLNANLT